MGKAFCKLVDRIHRSIGDGRRFCCLIRLICKAIFAEIRPAGGRIELLGIDHTMPPIDIHTKSAVKADLLGERLLFASHKSRCDSRSLRSLRLRIVHILGRWNLHRLAHHRLLSTLRIWIGHKARVITVILEGGRLAHRYHLAP